MQAVGPPFWHLGCWEVRGESLEAEAPVTRLQPARTNHEPSCTKGSEEGRVPAAEGRRGGSSLGRAPETGGQQEERSACSGKSRFLITQ